MSLSDGPMVLALSAWQLLHELASKALCPAFRSAALAEERASTEPAASAAMTGSVIMAWFIRALLGSQCR
jgi:hypothetical protein